MFGQPYHGAFCFFASSVQLSCDFLKILRYHHILRVSFHFANVLSNSFSTSSRYKQNRQLILVLFPLGFKYL